MGGIGAQELFILLFAVLAARFQYKMKNLESTATSTFSPAIPWRRLLYALYLSLVCITIRIIYRLVEYSGGMDTTIATSEAAFYCLEAAPMIIALVIFNLVHPGMVLVGEGSEFPKKVKKSKKDKKKEKEERSHSRRWKKVAERDLESGSGSDAEDIRLRDSLGRSEGGRI